jgi:hypothetical protein
MVNKGFQKVAVRAFPSIIFLTGTARGGVQLGQLRTAATNGPIVPAPDNFLVLS